MARRFAFLILSTFTLTAGFGPTSFAQTVQVLDFKPGEVIVGYRTDADRRAATRKFTTANQMNAFNVLSGQKTQTLEVSPFRENSLLVKFKLPPSSNAFAQDDPSFQRQLVDDLASQIKKMDPRVKYVYPNYIMGVPDQKPVTVNEKDFRKLSSATAKPTGAPNDPAFMLGLQWDYQASPVGMNAIGAWKITTGDRRIVVAVVDTGIVLSHPEIASSGNLLPGYNFVSDGMGRGHDPSDPSPISHGTHVAGTIGVGGTNNDLGIAGVNWAVSVLPVRVLNEAGNGSTKDIADGILWAAGIPVSGAPTNPTPADIINLSLGGALPCEHPAEGLMRDAINKARSAGTIVVVAAGNSSSDIAGFSPAGCPGVISVAAHDSRGDMASYSNFGDVSIIAPGGDTRQHNAGNLPLGVWSLTGGVPLGFAGLQGTSMAAPHVSGAIALALAKHEDWRHHPDLVAAALRASAVPVPQGACPNPCGPGQLDAQRLLELDQVPRPYEPATAAVSSLTKPSAKPGPVLSATLAVAPQPKSDPEPSATKIFGRWLMDQGGALVIEQGEWFHPAKGSASIELRGKELTVEYPQQTGVKCAYQVMVLENGNALYLKSLNSLQPDDFCPTGRLTSSH